MKIITMLAAFAVLSISLLASAETNEVKWLGQVTVIVGSVTNTWGYKPDHPGANYGTAYSQVSPITTNITLGVTSNGTLVVRP